jgi:hypothetical protein
MKRIYPYIAGFCLAWFIYMLAGTAMYTYELVKFYGDNYSFSEHGIALNGRTGWGDQINVMDLATVTPADGGGPIPEWCPNVSSNRGHITMGFVGEEGNSVCCWVADSNQWLVPYKDIGEDRHYLCGEWPFLDHVIQPIKNSKLNILSEM